MGRCQVKFGYYKRSVIEQTGQFTLPSTSNTYFFAFVYLDIMDAKSFTLANALAARIHGSLPVVSLSYGECGKQVNCGKGKRILSCDRCLKTKRSCDKQLPVCGRCAASGALCTYIPRKVGKPAKLTGYATENSMVSVGVQTDPVETDIYLPVPQPSPCASPTKQSLLVNEANDYSSLPFDLWMGTMLNSNYGFDMDNN
jgi:hypothetical protein